MWCNDNDFIIIAVWVDDMLIFTTTDQLKSKAIADVENKWEITDIRIPTKIVGIKLMITPDSISISSSRYIESILIKEGLDKSNAVSMPLNINITLVPNPERTEGNRSNDYAHILGELQYIANMMRPDIAYAVNQLASYTSNPSIQHYTALKRILRYLCGTRDYCITYRSLPEKTDFFYRYADATYANMEQNWSVTSYVFIAGDGTITWSSKRQISTMLSSVQAEYIALSEASHEVC